MAKTGTPRSAAQAFVDHLNAVLNATVSDARFSLLALPDDERAFEITRLVDGARAPLQLLGSPLRLFLRHTVVVEGGRCHTESYAYRLQTDATSSSWLFRWEYFRDPPRPDYPYPLAHLHVNGSFASGEPIAPLHIPSARVALESVLWHLISSSGASRRAAMPGRASCAIPWRDSSSAAAPADQRRHTAAPRHTRDVSGRAALVKGASRPTPAGG